MKITRKLLAVLLCAVMVAATNVLAFAQVQEIDFSSVSYANSGVSFWDEGEYIIKGSNIEHPSPYSPPLEIRTSGTFTLDNVNLIGVSVFPALGLSNLNSNNSDERIEVTLIIEGDNYLTSERGVAINQHSGVTLNIIGNGTLTVKSLEGDDYTSIAGNVTVAPTVTIIDASGSFPGTVTQPPTPTAPPAEPNANPLDSASDWAKEGITAAIGKGFVPTDIQGSYTNVITRQEFCRMAVKWVEYATGKNIDAVLSEKGLSRDPNAFSDTSDPDILAAFALGITSGTGGGQFTPNGEFSREQAATMIMNTCRAIGADVSNPPASDFVDMNSAAGWAVDGINFVRANGIMQGTGDDNFSPKANYTREQSIITFNNINAAALPGR